MKCFTVAVIVFGSIASVGAESLPKGMPSWLTPYPGAETKAEKAAEITYSVPAKPEEVIAHYGKLLRAASLPFLPNFDGIGTSIRAAAPECDLLIKIRESDNGTLTRIQCAVRAAGTASLLYGSEVGIADPTPPAAEKAEKTETPAPEPQKAAPETEPEQKKRTEPPPQRPRT